MILDGYTWSATVAGARVLYRPLLRDERTQLLELFGTDSDSWEQWAFEQLLIGGSTASATDTVMERFRELEPELIGMLLGVRPPNGVGDWSQDWELSSAKNLQQGVRLLRDFPGVAKRSCEDCKTWWYREDGSVVRFANNQPLRRPANTVLPCQTPSGCPKGTPESPRTLSPANTMALRHFRLCDATKRFPDDAIVARNAAIIRAVLSEKPK